MSDNGNLPVEDLELSEDEALRAFLPASFGAKSKEANIAAQIDRTRRLVGKAADETGAGNNGNTDSPSNELPRRGGDSNSDDENDSNSDNSDDDSDADDDDEYPVSHELVLKTHSRAVTTLSLDPAGARMITASVDSTIKLHDFASMTPTTLRAFRTVDPWETRSSKNSESHSIHKVQFNPLSGGVFLCISAHPQAKIMSRDGDVLTEFVKGDMYLRDMNNTSGHISEITSGCWHPSDRNLFVTSGTDSTLRIWDINNKRKQKDVIVFKSKAAGSAGRTRMTTVAWGAPAHGGSPILVTAALDGSLVMYSGNGPFIRPAGEVRNAHRPGTWTGGIDVSSDGRMVITRGGDDLIKLWDTRKFKDPVVAVSHLSTSDQYPTSNITYGPNSMSIIVGSSTGDLHILNPGNLQPEHVTPVTPGSPLIVVDWHPKINQIITGSGNAETHVLYHPTRSTGGAVSVMSKAPKKRHIDDNPLLTMDQSIGISGDAIITPGAARSGSRKAGVSASGKSRDPRRPQLQQQTPFMRNKLDDKHVAKNIPLARMLHEDPREALLKYASVAEKDPMFTSAWKETQPVTQYAEVSDDEPDEGPEKKRAKR